MVRDIVLMKLEAVGLRGARDLLPSEISGGMAQSGGFGTGHSLGPRIGDV
jgi:ABC-type transporter Mla maintaining outer membrane lipid asymmetry ATPase subunit MlaF